MFFKGPSIYKTLKNESIVNMNGRKIKTQDINFVKNLYSIYTYIVKTLSVIMSKINKYIHIKKKKTYLYITKQYLRICTYLALEDKREYHISDNMLCEHNRILSRLVKKYKCHSSVVLPSFPQELVLRSGVEVGSSLPQHYARLVDLFAHGLLNLLLVLIYDTKLRHRLL